MPAMTIRLDHKTCLWRGDEPAMGSGKADLLDAIIAIGAISGAAGAHGGRQGGGASVTAATRILRLSRRARSAIFRAILGSNNPRQ
jgi:molybdenum-dependent DNA-binding transcriptional regulator ModE